MDNFLQDLTQNATNIGKGAFLLVCGVVFVFAVQVIFYLVIKLWPRGGSAPHQRAG